MKKFLIPALLCITGYTHASPVSQVSVNATDLGWYQETGRHDFGNDNTLTGKLLATEYRSFYIWDLSHIKGLVTEARIDFWIPYSIGSSGYFSQTGRMMDVREENIPALGLQDGDGHGQEIFEDLGSGVQYGDIVVPSSYYYNYTLSVILNEDAISAINASQGSQFAIGMLNTSVDEDGYFLLSSMSFRGEQQLVLTVAEVPEPSQALLLVTALVALMSVRQRSRPAMTYDALQ